MAHVIGKGNVFTMNIRKVEMILDRYRGMPVRVKASLWFLACSFLQKGISVLTTPIFTRLMTTSEYGGYGVFNSWYDIISVVVTLKISAGVYPQAIIRFREEARDYSSSLQILNVLLCSTGTIIYLLFRGFWNKLFSLTTVQMLAMLIMIWVSEAFKFWMREQQVNVNYKSLAFLTILVSFAKPLVGIVCVVNANDKVTARILGLLLVEILAYFPVFIIQVRKGSKLISKKIWKYALGYNIPLVPHYLSQIVLNSSDKIMIEKMVDTSSAGIYTLAYSVASIMVLFNTSLSQTLDPWLLFQIKERKTDEIKKIAYPSLCAIALLNLALIAFAPEAVHLFAPIKYYDAIWVIPPVSMGTYFMFAYSLFACFSFYYQKTVNIMLISVSGAVLNLILNYVFIGMFGYVAAAFTTLVCYIFYSVGHYILMRRICKKYSIVGKVYDYRILLIISVVFCGMGFVFLSTYTLPIVRYALIIAFIIALVCFREKLKEFVVEIISIRKNRKDFK